MVFSSNGVSKFIPHCFIYRNLRNLSYCIINNNILIIIKRNKCKSLLGISCIVLLVDLLLLSLKRPPLFCIFSLKPCSSLFEFAFMLEPRSFRFNLHLFSLSFFRSDSLFLFMTTVLKLD